MKKSPLLLVALYLILALAACSSGSPNPSSPAGPPPPAGSGATTAAQADSSTSSSDSNIANGTFESGGRQYITADQLKADIEAGKDMLLLDIQLEENFNKNHLKGAVATYAFPVETDEQKSAVDAALDGAKNKPIIIICPGGKGGANNTWDYLVSINFDISDVYILENGQNGWPYPELLAAEETVIDGGIFNSNDRQYISADQLKAYMETGKDMFILDIQLEENFNKNHLKGAVATYAFPVETDEQKAAVDAVLDGAEGKPLIIVCPGGKGGANNTWDYLTSINYDMSDVYILENGQNGWPHPELLEVNG